MNLIFRTGISIKASLLAAIFGLVAVLILTNDSLQSQSRIRVPQTMLARDSLKVWVLFTDKGETTATPSRKAAISSAAIQRRDLRGTNAATDVLDREVNRVYIDQVRAHALRIVHPSRWLNAVSAYVTPAQLDDIAQLDCGKKAVVKRKEFQ